MRETITFDLRGHLLPHSPIQLNLTDFQNHFVDNFPESGTRKQIFENFLSYIQDFQKDIIVSFKMWINGSYVTRKLNPRDIDFVIFIPYDIYRANEQMIQAKYKTEGAEQFFSVDAYTIEVYPESHNKFMFTQSDTAYWRSWFGETARNRNNQRFQKGFIEINF